ncbi:Protein N-acetyltransferase, RimJ/RimL family [Nannocystis exedens]|uniref:Protein N-acetyltransferase, RimJ/RimL family n=1 Tax=Nannocystis exedens TaxID=54 RepID=A0A1I2JB58_9BACT|nr:GNAT family N-acetyltransferase [Nannocystis exedens]PCC70588.1 GNAT family acetyltransferase [Nannocystis exedens]SFF50126.1 Protein N-acetyltransferase, RimJ/RimL family [Nannocystis exedens]
MTAARAPETLTTARLQGARITADDRPFYRALWQDPEVTRTLGGPRTLAQIDAKIDRLVAMWPDQGFGVYTLREGDVARGYAGLAPTAAGGHASVEILYGFAPAVWRRGLATEVAGALVHLALDVLALPEVCGFTWTENAGSRRVLERAGLIHRFDFVLADLPHRYYSLSRSSRD